MSAARTLRHLRAVLAARGLQGLLDAPVNSLLEHSNAWYVRQLASWNREVPNLDEQTFGDLLGDTSDTFLLRLSPTQRAQFVHAIKQLALMLSEQAPRRVPVPKQDVDPPRELAAIEKMAAEAGISECLDNPALAMVNIAPSRELSALVSVMPDTTVREILCEEDWYRGRLFQIIGRPGVLALRSAAERYLTAEQQALTRGLALEREILNEGNDPQDDEFRLELIRRVRTLRLRFRVQATPRPAPEHAEIRPTDEGLVYVYRSRQYEPRLFDPVLLDFSVDPLTPRFEGDDREGDEEAHELPAGFGLWLCDAAIAWLRKLPPQSAWLKRMAMSPWERTFHALDQTLGAPRASADETLGWWLKKVGGTLHLQPMTRKPLKRGGWSKPRPITASLAASMCGESAAERRALEIIAPHAFEGGSGNYYTPPIPQTQVLRAVLALNGRAPIYADELWEHRLEVKVLHPSLTVVEQDARLELVARIGDGDVEVEAVLEQIDRAGELSAELDAKTNTLTIFSITKKQRELLQILCGGRATFPSAELERLFEVCDRIGQHLDVTVPETLRGEEVPPERRIVVRISPEPDALLLRVLARPLGDLALIPGHGALVVGAREGSMRRFTRRDLAAEASAAIELCQTCELDASSEDAPFVHRLFDRERALAIVERLHERPNVVLEWDKGAWRVHPLKPKNLSFKIGRRRDWFGLEGLAEVAESKVQLAVLLDVVRSGRKYVELAPGEFARISDELRTKLLPVALQTAAKGDAPVVGPAAMLAIEDLAAVAGAFSGDRSFSELRVRMERARTFEPACPAALEDLLRPYQRDGFFWLARLAEWQAGACLADDMGLGKTLQALALLEHRKDLGPALVIAPTSVAANWLTEARRFTPDLDVLLYREMKDRDRALALQKRQVLVISYGMMLRDVERISQAPFATAVFDEAHALKNADSKRAKAAREMNAEFRVALTGTPVENNLGELWALFDLIVPGLFPSREAFAQRFVRPIEKQKDPDRMSALKALVQPFLLRRKKEAVARELPPKIEIVRRVELSDAEKSLYEGARLAAIGRLNGVDMNEESSRFIVLSQLTRLRLCACHPRLYDESSRLGSSKLETLIETVKEIIVEGHRALIFSQFVGHLELVREAIAEAKIAYQYLDGSTPAQARDERVAAFQAGAGDVFLISLKAGGVGLNLTGADYVIHLDPWWNPAVEDQATDRAHRIGQARSVTVIRLVSAGTIEEEILALHAGKRELVMGLLDGSDVAAKWSTAALAALITRSADDRTVSEQPRATTSERGHVARGLQK
ncbi:MAG: DEAD/DEAH box helicase [Deltaproteobacteria bacterium]|nr:DEAD/DEAH box helicase [Deltaproteobacteria bacterium]